MRDFDDSTLWRISAYERMRAERGDSGFVRLDGQTVLPTSLVGELSRLDNEQRSGDPMEVIAACVRHRESALILLRHQGLVWPLTIFPNAGLYHLPRSIIESLESGARDLEVIAVEPPGLRPPGHAQWERVAEGTGYRHLAPLLWALAMNVSPVALLEDISGRAAFRASADFAPVGVAMAGALGPAVQRLRQEVVSLDEMARWPGLNRERVIRLLNAIYLQGGLMVLRTHHAARDTDHERGRWLGWMRPRR